MIGTSLARHPGVSSVQALLRGLNSDPGIAWTSPESWHITYAYLPNGELPVMYGLDNDDMFLVGTTGIDCWKTEEGYSTVILLNPQQLKDFQGRILKFAEKYEVSEYHLKNFRPHITIANSSERLTLSKEIPLSIVPVDNVEVRNRVMVAQRINLGAMKVQGRLLKSTEEGEHTRMTYVGLPYKGQVDGYDFHQTFFSRGTDIGQLDMQVPLKYYFDHGKFVVPHNGKAIGPGRSILGRAIVGDEDDELGRLIEVLIDRRSQYHDMLTTLDQMGILRGSAQAIGSMYDLDWETGEIKSFHLGEYSGTVTPSNEYNRPYDEARAIVLRSFVVENEEQKDHLSALGEILDSARTATTQVAEAATEVVTNNQEEVITALRSTVTNLETEIAALKEGQLQLGRTIKDTMEKMAADLSRNFRVQVAEAATQTSEEAYLNRSRTTPAASHSGPRPGSLNFQAPKMRGN